MPTKIHRFEGPSSTIDGSSWSQSFLSDKKFLVGISPGCPVDEDDTHHLNATIFLVDTQGKCVCVNMRRGNGISKPSFVRLDEDVINIVNNSNAVKTAIDLNLTADGFNLTSNNFDHSSIVFRILSGDIETKIVKVVLDGTTIDWTSLGIDSSYGGFIGVGQKNGEFRIVLSDFTNQSIFGWIPGSNQFTKASDFPTSGAIHCLCFKTNALLLDSLGPLKELKIFRDPYLSTDRAKQHHDFHAVPLSNTTNKYINFMHDDNGADNESDQKLFSVLVVGNDLEDPDILLGGSSYSNPLYLNQYENGDLSGSFGLSSWVDKDQSALSWFMKTNGETCRGISDRFLRCGEASTMLGDGDRDSRSTQGKLILSVKNILTGETHSGGQSPPPPPPPPPPSPPPAPPPAPPPPPSYSTLFYFGSGSPPSGYTQIRENTDYLVGTGYGWVNKNEVQKNANDINFIACKTGTTFRSDVPNGTYTVTITCGTSYNNRGLTTPDANGVSNGSLGTSTGQYSSVIISNVNVTNGHIIVTINHTQNPSSAAAIRLIEIN